MIPKRYSLRHLIYGIAIVAVLFAVGSYSIRAYRTHMEPAYQVRAIWLTHELLAAFLQRTNGEWPNGWHELQTDFDSMGPRPFSAPDLHWVRDRVAINFDIDPVSDVTIDDWWVYIPAITLADGTETNETRGANHETGKTILTLPSYETTAQKGT